jgi:hypothetical protein
MSYLQSLDLEENQIFYFNKELDYANQIKTNIELGQLYEAFKKEY